MQQESNITDRVAGLESAVGSMQRTFANHAHNGNDSNRTSFVDVAQKKVWVPYTLAGTSAAVSANYSTFYTAAFRCVVTGFTEVHCVAGTGGASSVQLERLTAAQAPGSGVAALSSAPSLTATINTVQSAIVSSNPSSKTLAIGDRLALLLGGTPTSVANVTVVVELTLI